MTEEMFRRVLFHLTHKGDKTITTYEWMGWCFFHVCGHQELMREKTLLMVYLDIKWIKMNCHFIIWKTFNGLYSHYLMPAVGLKPTAFVEHCIYFSILLICCFVYKVSLFRTWWTSWEKQLLSFLCVIFAPFQLSNDFQIILSKWESYVWYS